jgi:hypothetical protein
MGMWNHVTDEAMIVDVTLRHHMAAIDEGCLIAKTMSRQR